MFSLFPELWVRVSAKHKVVNSLDPPTSLNRVSCSHPIDKLLFFLRFPEQDEQEAIFARNRPIKIYELLVFISCHQNNEVKEKKDFKQPPPPKKENVFGEVLRLKFTLKYCINV